MGRAQFTEPVGKIVTIEGADLLQLLDGVQVTVYKIKADGTREAAPAALFAARSMTDNTPFDNPFVTPAGGKTGFWANGGDYDVVYHDTQVPARIGDQSSGWQAVSGADDGLLDAQLPGAGTKQWAPGDLCWTARLTLKPGFLWADGAVVSRTTYADLYNEIGTAFNIGGESASQFRLPDYRGRSPIGADTMGVGAAGRLPNTNRARGQSAGEERHALLPAEGPIRNHSHSGTTGTEKTTLTHDHPLSGGASEGQVVTSGTGGAAANITQGGGQFAQRDLDPSGPAAHQHDITTGNPDGGQFNGAAHNVVHPVQVCHVQIKF